MRVEPSINHVLRRMATDVHRDQRGGVGILLVLLAFVLVALIGMVWNTGEFSTRKMRAQAVADTAAYGAAQHNARALNLITASNKVIVRTASAEVLAISAVETLVIVGARLTDLSIKATKLMGGLWTFWAGVELAAQLVPEWQAYVRFAKQVFPAIRKVPQLRQRLRQLDSYQQAVVAQTPRWIEQQRSHIEIASGHQVYLTQAGAAKPGTVSPPVRPGDLASLQATLVAQVNSDRKKLERMLRPIRLGGGQQTWLATTNMTSLFIAGTTKHHVLITQTFTAELAPSNYQRDTAFTVLAVASTDWSTKPQPFIPRYFGKPVRDVVAYGAAETFNGHDNPVTGVTGVVLPWRVWSKQGWWWRPRLTHAEALRLTIQQSNQDQKLADMFQRAGIRFYGSKHDLHPVNLH